MPSAGIDNQGNIFVSYSSLVENVDQGSQNFRHVHVVKSMDGGTTWSSPKDVTPHDLWGGAQECVFARMDRNVDDKIRLIYQKDFEPGLAVRGDEDIIDLNEIIYLELDTFELSNSSTNVINNNLNINFSVYPNPADDKITLDLYSENSSKITLVITNILGKQIRQYSLSTFAGENRFNIGLADFENGVYFINFNNNNIKHTEKFIISK
jgi:hypothetical protein